MKLSISNIAWTAKDDEAIYRCAAAAGFSGLEVAPTRLFPEAPYTRGADARAFRDELWTRYGLAVSSMQSIWYGRTERLFGSEAERAALLSYTERAILFAEALGCGNLVFGCPKNRVLPPGEDGSSALSFFRAAGAFAARHHVVLALEANPAAYGTNFMTQTEEAAAFCRRVQSEGVGLNYDLGCALTNGEDIAVCFSHIDLISHVHISEPGLQKIARRAVHRTLLDGLRASGYRGFVSIEMGAQSAKEVAAAIAYLGELCV